MAAALCLRSCESQYCLQRVVAAKTETVMKFQSHKRYRQSPVPSFWTMIKAMIQRSKNEINQTRVKQQTCHQDASFAIVAGCGPGPATLKRIAMKAESADQFQPPNNEFSTQMHNLLKAQLSTKLVIHCGDRGSWLTKATVLSDDCDEPTKYFNPLACLFI